MIALGIETSSRVCSVGLADESGSLGMRSLAADTVHSEQLLHLTNELFKSTGKDLRDIGCIAVSSGPGSFTGLRIGFSSAKGLSFATGRPIVVVPSFHALAFTLAESLQGDANILVALDAKKGDFYTGMFRSSRGLVERTAGETLTDLQGLSGMTGSADIVVTDAPGILREVTGSKEIHEASGLFRGDVVARLGIIRSKTEGFTDSARAEPLYLKDFVVKRKGSAS